MVSRRKKGPLTQSSNSILLLLCVWYEGHQNGSLNLIWSTSHQYIAQHHLHCRPPQNKNVGCWSWESIQSHECSKEKLRILHESFCSGKKKNVHHKFGDDDELDALLFYLFSSQKFKSNHNQSFSICCLCWKEHMHMQMQAINIQEDPYTYVHCTDVLFLIFFVLELIDSWKLKHAITHFHWGKKR